MSVGISERFFLVWVFWKRSSTYGGATGAGIGFEHAGKQVFLGDDAAWIWKMAEELFPQAIQALDLYHALEKIGDVVTDNFKDKKEQV